MNPKMRKKGEKERVKKLEEHRTREAERTSGVFRKLNT
jgi:hypothetical protein